MSRPIALVTGAEGEMGHMLIPALRRRGFGVVGLDLAAVDPTLREQCIETVEASITDVNVLRGLMERHAPTCVFHLAAVLSAKAERAPDLAHRVNVQGTYGLLRLCLGGATGGVPIRFLYPSSIAIYGLGDAATKQQAGAVRETEWNVPSGMYGCNKLYGELLGSYLTRRHPDRLDFRAIRFPGLISAETLPTGGTTDYAPEMIHAAAQGQPYVCFVEEESRLPFMTMPDGIEALLALAEADPAALSTRVYNIRSFSASAGELARETRKHFPGAEIRFESVAERQVLVDSWPADVDDGPARRDWGLSPRHGLAEAMSEYLVPAVRARYSRVVESLPRSEN